MKVKDAEIRIGTIEDFKKAVGEAIKGPVPETDRSVVFVRDAKMLSKVLSEKRLELMRAIKGHPDYNVSQLAELLGRKQEAISRDISILKKYGMVVTEKREKEVYPEVRPTHVLIEI
jgi:predicted transcriptional regulator